MIAKSFYPQFSKNQLHKLKKDDIQELTSALKHYNSKKGFLNDINQDIADEIITKIKIASSQASLPDNYLGWGIPDFELASGTLSLQNVSVEKKLSLYPNPVSDKLTIGFPASLKGKYTIEIVNVQGKVIYSYQGNQSIIHSIQLNDIEYLPSGVYFIKLSDRNSVFSGKILKM